jgi:hypothetical protein
MSTSGIFSRLFDLQRRRPASIDLYSLGEHKLRDLGLHKTHLRANSNLAEIALR